MPKKKKKGFKGLLSGLKIKFEKALDKSTKPGAMDDDALRRVQEREKRQRNQVRKIGK